VGETETDEEVSKKDRLARSERLYKAGLAAMSSPQPTQYDSMSFTQYGLAFRIEVGWLDGIFAFDAICPKRDPGIIPGHL
jgi:hypothetical protein